MPKRHYGVSPHVIAAHLNATTASAMRDPSLRRETTLGHRVFTAILVTAAVVMMVIAYT